MKAQILLFCLSLFSAAFAFDTCSKKECGAGHADNCTPKYGTHIAKVHTTNLINLLIKQSYEHLFTGAYFDGHSHNRPGFAKMFDKLSDEAWEESRELLKHTYKRGLSHTSSEVEPLFFNHKSEISSLGRALDMHKEKATAAFKFSEHSEHDPEIISFMEEHLLHKDSKWIRDISGYISDVNKMIADSGTVGLGLEIFDSYLLSKY